MDSRKATGRRTTRIVRDYADTIKYQSRQYRRGPAPGLEDMRLGKLIFTIRGTLALRDDGNPRSAPQLLDEEATTLPAGTPVHEIIGYPASTYLGVYLRDKLRVYIARE